MIVLPASCRLPSDVFYRADFPLGAVAIPERRGRMNGDGVSPVYASKAAQGFSQYLFFKSKLQIVRNMLVMAATADAEMGTFGLNALYGTSKDVFQPAAREFLASLFGCDLGFFAGQHEWDEESCAVAVSETFAAVNEFFDFHAHGGPYFR